MKVFLVFITVLASSFALANLPFQEGIKLYQEGSFNEALNHFQKHSKESGPSAGNLYNAGLAAYHAGRKGLAVAMWRRALDLNADLLQAQKALKIAETEMPREVFNFGEGFFANFKYKSLRAYSLNRILGVHFLLFIFTGWLLLRHFFARRESLMEEKALPPPPYMGSFFAVLLVALSLTAYLRYSLDVENRATIVEEGVHLRTDASGKGTELFQTLSGMEFRIEKLKSDWVLLSRPDGMTGWANTATLFQTSGDPLW